MAHSIPHLQKTAHSYQLIVDGKPFLILGGEVQNSQFSSGRYMKSVWQRLKDGNVNTVFGSVSWEQIEPKEGEFDFTELNGIVKDAREHDLRLILLWFGSFKNGLSTYTPAWVKQNPKRFPRAELRIDRKSNVGDALSVFGTEAQHSDSLAFTAFMSHLRQLDEQHSTVIMIQVQNEVGLLGDSRDRSALAEIAWRQPVPAHLLDWMQQDFHRMNLPFRTNFARLPSLEPSTPITWSQLPADGDAVDELFMAYHYALYVEHVAAAGKAAYPLPMFSNVWQNYAPEACDPAGADAPATAVAAGGGRPGDYPSGGGVTNVLDVWKRTAPALDLIAPDIYLNDYACSCAAYRHRGQALLIPEQRRDEYGARRIWTAFGTHQALGTAPFGIDTLSLTENPFRRHYGLLRGVQRHVLDAQLKENGSVGFFFDELREDGGDPSPAFDIRFGEWKLKVERSFVFGQPGPGCGMIIHRAENEFLLVGWGFQVRVESTRPTARFAGILRCREVEVENVQSGKLRKVRWLNGDETRSGTCATMPNEDPDYRGFPICITIPARTGIALVEPYALAEDDLERRN